MAASRAARIGRLLGALGPLVLALLLLVVLGTPVLAPETSSPADAGPDGLERFQALAEGTGYDVQTAALSPVLAERLDPGTSLVAIVGPQEGVTDAEATWLGSFHERGGRVLIADGGGQAVGAASEFGIPLRVRNVYDAGASTIDPARVPATMSVGDRSFALELRAPLVIATTPEASYTPLVRTGNRTFVDLDGNRNLDANDTRGPFTVAAASQDGRAIVLGSAELFTNEGSGLAGNEEAARALLIELLPQGGTVVVATSHAEHGPAGVVVTGARATVAVAQQPAWGLGLAFVAGLVALVALVRHVESPGRWSGERPGPAAVCQAPSTPLDAPRLREDLAGVHEGQQGLVASGDDRRREEVNEALERLEQERPRS